MTIKCPQCFVEFLLKDIQPMIRDGCFTCPVCGRKISVAANTAKPDASPSRKINRKFLAMLFVAGACLIGVLFYVAANKQLFGHGAADSGAHPPASVAPQADTRPVATSPATSAAPGDVRPASAPEENQAPPDKMKIIERIAAQYHKSHSYTLEGDFVCLDMAIDVWNQLVTHGIEAKIMGGNIRENITAWNFRQLAQESDHAWVVAQLDPGEKVAIETTQGKIITPDMPNASAYFKGIEFDSPAQIKHFDLLRRRMNDVCRSAQDLIIDWNQNVAGKPIPAADAIAKKSRIEQKKQECENTYQELKSFEGKAIFY